MNIARPKKMSIPMTRREAGVLYSSFSPSTTLSGGGTVVRKPSTRDISVSWSRIRWATRWNSDTLVELSAAADGKRSLRACWRCMRASSSGMSISSKPANWSMSMADVRSEACRLGRGRVPGPELRMVAQEEVLMTLCKSDGIVSKFQRRDGRSGECRHRRRRAVIN